MNNFTFTKKIFLTNLGKGSLSSLLLLGLYHFNTNCGLFNFNNYEIKQQFKIINLTNGEKNER